jgi:hypothetical protein
MGAPAGHSSAVRGGDRWATASVALEQLNRYDFAPNQTSGDVAVIDSRSDEVVANPTR